MVLVVRKDLKMTAGKIGAQCAHAAIGAYDLALNDSTHPEWQKWTQLWGTLGSTKITLQTEDESSLLSLTQAAKEAGVPYYLVRDAGRTQVAPGSQTVLAIGPGPVEVVDKITGSLKIL